MVQPIPTPHWLKTVAWFVYSSGSSRIWVGLTVAVCPLCWYCDARRPGVSLLSAQIQWLLALCLATEDPGFSRSSVQWWQMLGHAQGLLNLICLENPHGQRSLEGCGPWGRKESDTIEQLSRSRMVLS